MQRSRLEGGRIVLATAAILVVLVTIALAGVGVSQAGALWLTRATARVSLTVFVITFSASAVNGLWPGPTGKWLLRNRRYLGLSFATSHAVHAAAFLAYGEAKGPSIAALVAPTTLFGGSVGYVLVALMALTSTDAAVRRIGRRSWTVLHKTGMYVLFGIFVFSYLGPALLGRPLGIAAMGVLMGALVLRIANRMRRRR